MTAVRALAVTLLVAAACSHPAIRRTLPDVAWPEPPAPARARLVTMFPDPAAPAPPRPVWRRVLEFLVGRGDDDAAWLARPFGVAAVDGAWFVADPDAQEVLRIDARGPSRVACPGREWAAPMAVANGPGGALYVADGGAGEIVVAEADGRCRAIGAGVLERPTGVAVAGDRLVVADPPRHELVVFSAAGDLVARWGGRGEGEGRFHYPCAVAAAPDGTLLVVDALNFRVVRLGRDGSWVGEFGMPGETGGDLARPKGIASDDSGRVYVSDAQRDLVLVFDAGGTFEYAIGASGTAPGRLSLPAGVAVAGGRLYVADSYNGRVQVFELVGGGS